MRSRKSWSGDDDVEISKEEEEGIVEGEKGIEYF